MYSLHRNAALRRLGLSVRDSEALAVDCPPTRRAAARGGISILRSMAALTIAMVFTACSDSAPPPAAPAPDAAAPVDDAPVEADEGRAIPDSGPAQQDDGVVVDTGPVEPPSPCEARCWTAPFLGPRSLTMATSWDGMASIYDQF